MAWLSKTVYKQASINLRNLPINVVQQSFAQVEGIEKAQRSVSENNPYSLLGAYTRLEELGNEPDLTGFYHPEDVVAEVYGDGGINRYFVRRNGEILFSRSHAISPKAIQKAIAAGFTIWE
jgi:hypothetical protein